MPLLIGGSGQPPSFSDDIEPWFGGEIAVAVVPGGAGTQQVQMLEVSDTKGAREYEASIAAGEPQPEDYQGTELREDDRGLATAIVDDFLVIGTADGVRSVIDVAQRAWREPTRSKARDMRPMRSKRSPRKGFARGLSLGGGNRLLPRALRRRARARSSPWWIPATRKAPRSA